MKDLLVVYAGGVALGCPACDSWYLEWQQVEKDRGPLTVRYVWRCPTCGASWSECLDADGLIIALRSVNRGRRYPAATGAAQGAGC